MSTKRKICIVTGTRAEYGLLYWLMKEVDEDPVLQLQIIATGMHLSPEFGLTYQEIEADGFKIDAKVEMLLSSDSPVGIVKSMGLGLVGFADALDRLKPDIVVLLGDRFEILAAAQAALVARMPIAHIHGGESTEGLIDEPIRHAITKMAHLHFTAAKPYQRRVIQMGESPERVFCVGAPGLDHIHRKELLGKADLEKSIGLHLDNGYFLVTYHPVTLEKETSASQAKALLTALDAFPKHSVLFTASNSDTDGRIIGSLIDEYVKKNPARCVVHTSLGQLRYLSAIRHADVVVGNSSSGLTEAPALFRATVNIGDRQRGRLMADSVISCGNESKEIVSAIEKALSQDFQATLKDVKNPYGAGGASKKIKDILKNFSLDENLLKKSFYALQ